ncbi:MAG: hypothetical protein Pars2KO_32820 [Parasphingorhabdus sp.]
MAYFEDNYDSLSFPSGNPGFRQPQLAAVFSIAAHFFNSTQPAIVVMPTGSGKTIIATTISYLLRAKRVLVITPSRLLREQISEKFSTMADMQHIQAIPLMSETPKVGNITKRLNNQDDWENLKQYDVVVSTVYSLATGSGDNLEIPDDLFDLVIVDEGHHAPAATWTKVLSQLENTKKILLTATPFRKDSKEIIGKIVFVYDIRRAHADGVFGDLHFLPVTRTGAQSVDEAIALETEKKYQDDKEAGYSHLVMVRVDSISRGRELAKLYAEKTDLKLAFVQGSSALSTVKKAIAELQNGTLDGLICVNMFGEGFDLPKLKIAALHSPHKSLAVTLQFIGRFARTNDPQIGAASFIAYPEDQQNELKELWTSGTLWPEIVHNINAEKIFSEASNKMALDTFENVGAEGLPDLSLYNIKPYFHAKIYKCEDGVDLKKDFPATRGQNVVFSGISDENSARILIRQIITKPRWLVENKIQNVSYELDILHYNEEQNLLFICSSTKSLDHYAKIGIAYSSGRTRALSALEINRALNGVDGLEFFHVGMRKRQFGGRTESYRTVSGPKADASVDEMDGQIYNRGHSFGKGRSGGEDITIGISASSKIWSNSVDTIPSLIDWCDSLATRIGSATVQPTGSNLDILSPGVELTTLSEEIGAAIFHSKTYVDGPRVYFEADLLRDRGELGQFEIEVTACNDKQILFDIVSDTLRWSGIYDLDSFPLILPSNPALDQPAVGGRDGETSIAEYLNEYPPRFFTIKLDAIEGNSLFSPPNYHASLQDDDFEIVDWEEAGIDIEKEKPENGQTDSIFDWLTARLKASDAQFIFNDDGAGEVADFIAVSNFEDRSVVALYHCKASTKPNAGSRVDDLYDVCGQSVKCGIWLRQRALIEQLENRAKKPSIKGMIKGGFEDLKLAFSPERRQKIEFHLYIVQPGISVDKIKTNPMQILVGAKNFARAANFSEYRIICSS